MTDKGYLGVFEDVAEAFGAAMNARDAIMEGRYCECVEPDLSGGLMCFSCRLRNKSQELAAVQRMVDAHSFVARPGDSITSMMCEVCGNWEDNARHQGVPAVGRTSWGEEVQGVPLSGVDGDAT